MVKNVLAHARKLRERTKSKQSKKPQKKPQPPANPEEEPENVEEQEESILKIDAGTIRDKFLRSELRHKQQVMRDKLRGKRKAERKEQGIKITPKTQEMRREHDPSIIQDYNVGINHGDNEEQTEEQMVEAERRQAMLEEIREEEQFDEFDSYFENLTKPKLLITYGLNGFKLNKPPSKVTKRLCRELMHVIPNAFYLKRKASQKIQDVVEFAKTKEFTDLMIIGEHQNRPYSLILVHLPNGPTAHFRISSTHLHDWIEKRDRAGIDNDIDNHPPELILNNFTTRLGLRMGRMITALFPQNPSLQAKRVVTFHNQRDFVFFRHHKYEFDEKSQRCNLTEIGPRFTLRLQKLQIGTFDAKFGEYEWFHKSDMDTSRRRFFL